MSTTTDPMAVLNPPVERRFYPRVTPSAPIYVAFGPNNLGTLLNVSENGLLVATPSGLDVNSAYRVFLTLDGSPSAITVSVRTIWTDTSQNSSGIQLLDLSEQHREQIREWVAAQTYRNEHLDDWVPPKEPEPSPDAGARETTEPLPNVAKSSVAESQNKPVFPPMPLPIHGEFTYEPAPGPQKEQFLVRRRRSAVRSNSRSSAVSTILWTVLVAAVGLAAAWPYRDRVSDLLLHRRVPVASESTKQADQSASSVVPDGSTAPAQELPSPSDTDQGPNQDGASNGGNSNPVTPLPSATSKTLSIDDTSKHFEPSARDAKANLGTVSKRTTRPEVLPARRSYEAYSKVVDSAPRAPTKNPVPVPAPAAEDLLAPAITVPATAGPAPAPASPTPASTSTATSQPSTKAPAASDSVAKSTSGDTMTRKSAIAGSISNSAHPGNLSAGGPSDAPASSATPLTAAATAAPRADSSVTPKSNPSSPAVIQMDVPEARVIELKAPRSLAGTFAATLVNLPGERVIRSASVAIHIQRSVRIPRERIPGERWLWRGHEKIALGELSSRVDPQAPQVAASYGSITIEASIDKDGYVTEVKPLHGSFALLPSAARAIREWRYEPTYLNDKPVETQARIELDFHSAPTRSSKP
jgi:hypothetical protein